MRGQLRKTARMNARACVAVSFVVVCAACAGRPAVVDAVADGPLAGCVLQAGPAALCDDGAVLVDVATGSGAPADRIAQVHEATDRPDDMFQLTPGTPGTADDGVTRVDIVHPWHVDAAVGTVTFFAPATGNFVVSCAAFDAGTDARCRARSLALLETTVPPTSTFQHRPALALPARDGCTGSDDPLALQRLCKNGEKLSVVGIRGHFGPAASWWLFHRVVGGLATSVRLFAPCRVLGQHGPCGIVNVKEQLAMFGAAVERDELRIAACFFSADSATDGVPRVCVDALAAEPVPPQRRLLAHIDVPVTGCAFTQPNDDSWSRSVSCDDGAVVAQFADDKGAAALVQQLEAKGSTSGKASCLVRGAAATCQVTQAPGRVVWRADVDDPRVASFVCSGTTSTLPALCHGFIDPIGGADTQ